MTNLLMVGTMSNNSRSTTGYETKGEPRRTDDTCMAAGQSIPDGMHKYMDEFIDFQTY